MKIDQTIETGAGTIVFRGEVSQEEFDYIMKMGLAAMYIKGELSSTVMTDDGSIISDVPDSIQ